MRPCTCDRATVGNITPDCCPACWKWKNSPWWRIKWATGRTPQPFDPFTVGCLDRFQSVWFTVCDSNRFPIPPELASYAASRGIPLPDRWRPSYELKRDGQGFLARDIPAGDGTHTIDVGLGQKPDGSVGAALIVKDAAETVLTFTFSGPSEAWDHGHHCEPLSVVLEDVGAGWTDNGNDVWLPIPGGRGCITQ